MDTTEILNFLWAEIKIRQDHYWSSFNKFGLMIITVMVIPFIRPEIADMLGRWIVVFPIISLFLAIICTWYLAAEYQRLRMVRKKYEEMLFTHCEIPRMPRSSIWQRLIAARIGTRTSVIWGVSFFLASICTIIILVTHFE
jgi:hypothetical protein